MVTELTDTAAWGVDVIDVHHSAVLRNAVMVSLTAQMDASFADVLVSSLITLLQQQQQQQQQQ